MLKNQIYKTSYKVMQINVETNYMLKPQKKYIKSKETKKQQYKEICQNGNV